jgi:serine/threonine-protein kinase ATR
LLQDARLMEVNGMVNRLLQRCPGGRQRRLRLRTYAVLCLNEECGVLEWVPNTTGFRQVRWS